MPIYPKRKDYPNGIDLSALFEEPLERREYKLDRDFLDRLEAGRMFKEAGGFIQAMNEAMFGEDMPGPLPRERTKPEFLRPKDLTPVAPPCAKFLRKLVDNIEIAGVKLEERFEDPSAALEGITIRATAYKLPFRDISVVSCDLSRDAFYADPDARRKAACKLLGELQYGIIDAEFKAIPCKHLS